MNDFLMEVIQFPVNRFTMILLLISFFIVLFEIVLLYIFTSFSLCKLCLKLCDYISSKKGEK